MRRLALMVIGALASSACFNDFLVGPDSLDSNVTPRLIVLVRVRHGEGASYDVFANLRAGTDAEGNGRTLVDSTVTVADSAIRGAPAADRSQLIYSWSDSTTLTLRDTIAVKGPTLADQTSATATMLIPLPARGDAALRDLIAGEDIALSFSALGEAPYGFGSSQGVWLLEIQDARRNLRLLSLNALSTPTSPIVIPTQLVSTVAGDSLVATLTFNSSFASVLAAYPTFLAVSTRLEWRMRVVAASSP